METTAKLRYLRMSPRKVRLVVDAIRGVSVEQALARLKFSDKRAVQPVAKLLNSAIANAEHNQDLKRDNLLIKEIKVDEGPVLKRW
ncbi:50S ribosomal protein L22, partial [Candidatus Kuenenbacteria bacterium CG23_combo_of_CG06-09_8_20_14_all_39_39]